MTITAYPFDDVDTTETQYSALISALQSDGFSGVPGDAAAACTPVSGMQVSVAPFPIALAAGFAIGSNADESLTLEIGSGQARIDRIVLRLSIVSDDAELAILEGTPGSGSPPALTQDLGDVYEIPVCRINVGSSMVNVGSGDIVDERRWLGLQVGAWSTGTRPLNARDGQLGFNFTTRQWEWRDGSSWSPLIPSIASDQISDSTARGRALLTAASLAAAREQLGLIVSSTPMGSGTPINTLRAW